MTFGGYKVGRTYNRRRDIHGRFGGQRQGGICTPKDHAVVVAFTGASGRQHGYADGWAADGVYRYFGEGQTGDLSWKGGNVAIRDHAANGEDLLLFETLGGWQRPRPAPSLPVGALTTLSIAAPLSCGTAFPLPPDAISCLGAFRTPAGGACLGSCSSGTSAAYRDRFSFGCDFRRSNQEIATRGIGSNAPCAAQSRAAHVTRLRPEF